MSERFLTALRLRQEENVVFSTISDIILDFAENHFQTYIKYCSNQVFQDRTLQSLLSHNPAFSESLKELEKDPKCQMLSMQSFLMLPMQRITRLPLLVDQICQRCEAGNNIQLSMKICYSWLPEEFSERPHSQKRCYILWIPEPGLTDNVSKYPYRIKRQLMASISTLFVSKICVCASLYGVFVFHTGEITVWPK